jgi:hypothetical protein
MKAKLLLAALVAMAASNPVIAQRLIGNVDCGKWVKDQSTTPPNLLNRAWVAGYISGLNIGDEKARNTLKNISSADQIFLWMDNYCKANPLKDVSYGAETLMEELRKK